MSDRPHIGLGDPAFRGRLRQPAPRPQRHMSGDVRRPFGPRIHHVTHSKPAPITPRDSPSKPFQDVIAPSAVLPPQTVQQPIRIVAPQPFSKPAHPKQQNSKVLHRQAVRHPQAIAAIVPVQVQDQIKTRPKRNLKHLIVVGMAGFVFIVGLGVSLMTLQTNQSTKAQVQAISKTASAGEAGAAADNAPPTEDKPTADSITKYKVAPDFPRLLTIPKLYVHAKVKPMGVNAQNELQAPANIFDAGWYNASAKPGDSPGSGATVIDGHVHGPSSPGLFYNLKKLVSGDQIKITRGDGKEITYTVVRSQEYEAANMDIGVALASATPGKHGLNLITCSGSYDKNTNEYTKRTIVFAVQS